MNKLANKKTAEQAITETVKQGEAVWTEWPSVDKLFEAMDQHVKRTQRSN